MAEPTRRRGEHTFTRKRVALVATLVLATAGVSAATLVFRRDMGRAYERVRGRSQVIASPYGDIEFADGGSGPPVLVVHGSGGGFDQAQLMVEAVIGDRFHWIAPSRFGYLRSTFHAGATFDDQAHAFAALLDHLEVDRVAVVALLHGGPSALLFAVMHPSRVSSLTLISAGVASAADADQAAALHAKDDTLQLYRHAEFAAAMIPGARLHAFARGGHLRRGGCAVVKIVAPASGR